MDKIKDYTFGQEVIGLVVRLSDVHIRKTTSGADYASMLAYDGEEVIEAKIWSFTDSIKSKLINGEVYKVNGRFKDYQGKMQLNITDIELADDGVDKSKFYESAKVSKGDLKAIIYEYVSHIDNTILREIVDGLLCDASNAFFTHPAAVSMHHNYISGLAYHTYSMLNLSNVYLDQYRYLNKDLVYAGIILHDIGKTVELSGAKGTEYTFDGQLLGHISIGSNLVYAKAKELGYENSEEAKLLNHIILSHHGELEFGSPKEPATPEALLIHLLDLADSKLAALEKEIEKVNGYGFTQPINSFGKRGFYIPKIESNK